MGESGPGALEGGGGACPVVDGDGVAEVLRGREEAHADDVVPIGDGGDGKPPDRLGDHPGAAQVAGVPEAAGVEVTGPLEVTVEVRVVGPVDREPAQAPRVLERSEYCLALAEQLGRCGVVALTADDGAEEEPRVGAAPDVAGGFEVFEALRQQTLGRLRLAADEPNVTQPVERPPCAGVVSRRSRQSQAGFEVGPGGVVIGLSEREEPGAIQRPHPQRRPRFTGGPRRPIRNTKRQHRFEPASALGEVAAYAPEPRQCGHQAQAGVDVAAGLRPRQSGSQVGVVTIQTAVELDLSTADQLRVCMLCERYEVRRVAAPERLGLAHVLGAPGGELADHLEHVEPGFTLIHLVLAHQALVHQRRQRVDRARRITAVSPRARLDDSVASLRCAPPDEDRQLTEHPLVGGDQRPITPIDGTVDRLQATRGVAWSVGEQR